MTLLPNLISSRISSFLSICLAISACLALFNNLSSVGPPGPVLDPDVLAIDCVGDGNLGGETITHEGKERLGKKDYN